MTTAQIIIITLSLIVIALLIFFLIVINNVRKYKWAALVYSFIWDFDTYRTYKLIKKLPKAIPMYTMWSPQIMSEEFYYVYDYNVWLGKQHLVISNFYKPLIDDIIISNTLS